LSGIRIAMRKTIINKIDMFKMLQQKNLIVKRVSYGRQKNSR